MLVQQDGKAVGFLPRGAGCGPEGELSLGSPAGDQFGNQQRAERFKRALVAKERGLVGHHRAEHVALERRVEALAHPIDERVEAGYFPLADDRRQPRHDEVLFRAIDDDAGALPKEFAEEGELVRADLHACLSRASAAPTFQPQCYLDADLRERQDGISQPRANDLARHSPDHARELILRDHCPSRLDDLS